MWITNLTSIAHAVGRVHLIPKMFLQFLKMLSERRHHGDADVGIIFANGEHQFGHQLALKVVYTNGRDIKPLAR